MMCCSKAEVDSPAGNGHSIRPYGGTVRWGKRCERILVFLPNCHSFCNNNKLNGNLYHPPSLGQYCQPLTAQQLNYPLPEYPTVWPRPFRPASHFYLLISYIIMGFLGLYWALRFTAVSLWLQFEVTVINLILTKPVSKCLLSAYISSKLQHPKTKHPNPCPFF